MAVLRGDNLSCRVGLQNAIPEVKGGRGSVAGGARNRGGNAGGYDLVELGPGGVYHDFGQVVCVADDLAGQFVIALIGKLADAIAGDKTKSFLYCGWNGLLQPGYRVNSGGLRRGTGRSAEG